MNISALKSPHDSHIEFLQNRKPSIELIWQSSKALQTLQIKAEKREILQKCIQKIRQFTQVRLTQSKVKSYYQMLPIQLSLIDDHGSDSQQTQTVKLTKYETKFEKLYQQSREQTGKLKRLVMKLLSQKNQHNSFTFRPSNPIMILWNLFKLMLLIHICFIFPLMDAFSDVLNPFIEYQSNLFTFEWIFLVFLQIIKIVDLLLRFNVQVYKDGQLITSNTQIALLYLRSGFIVDVIGFIGFTSFLYFDIVLLRYFFFLKYPEMKKFLKFLRRELDPQNKFQYHLRLLRLLGTVCILAHIIACAWLWIGRQSESSESWLQLKHLVDKDWTVQYVFAFYFAILTMTTVGYGDIVPMNVNEAYGCIVIIVVSCGVFAYTLNTITSVLKDIDYEKHKLKEEMILMQNYLIKKGIDNDLQRKVQIYLKQMWKSGQNEKLIQQMDIFAKLSTDLQQEIHLQDRGYMFLKIPFLVNNFSLEFLKQLLNKVQESYYQPSEIIDKGSGLYIIYQGQADLCVQLNNKLKSITTLQTGEFYGLRNLFDCDSKYVLKSNGFSIIYFIPTDLFIKCLKDTDYEKFCMIKQCVRNGNQEYLYETCELCKRRGHEICQDIVYKPNKIQVITKYNHSRNQDRQKFDRRQVKFQILRDFKNVQRTTSQFKEDQKKLILKQKSFVDQSEIQEENSQQLSSESWRFETSRIDERKSDNAQSPMRPNSRHRLSSVSRKTIIMPQFIAVNPLRRKQTQELSVQANTPLKQSPQKQSAHKLTLNLIQGQETEDFSTLETLQFDQVKSFSSFYKIHNIEEILKGHNRRLKSQRRLKKMILHL